MPLTFLPIVTQRSGRWLHGETGRQLFEAIAEFLPTSQADGLLTGIRASAEGLMADGRCDDTFLNPSDPETRLIIRQAKLFSHLPPQGQPLRDCALHAWHDKVPNPHDLWSDPGFLFHHTR